MKIIFLFVITVLYVTVAFASENTLDNTLENVESRINPRKQAIYLNGEKVNSLIEPFNDEDLSEALEKQLLECIKMTSSIKNELDFDPCEYEISILDKWTNAYNPTNQKSNAQTKKREIFSKEIEKHASPEQLVSDLCNTTEEDFLDAVEDQGIELQDGWYVVNAVLCTEAR